MQESDSYCSSEMVEAWMLADKELLKEEMGTRMSDEELGINRMPELYLDPKATIIQAIGKSNRTTTRRHRKDLDISELYASIGARLELESCICFLHIGNLWMSQRSLQTVGIVTVMWKNQ